MTLLPHYTNTDLMKIAKETDDLEDQMALATHPSLVVKKSLEKNPKLKGPAAKELGREDLRIVEETRKRLYKR